MPLFQKLKKAINKSPPDTDKEDILPSEANLAILPGSLSASHDFRKQLKKGRYQKLKKLVLHFTVHYGFRQDNRKTSYTKKLSNMKILEEIGKLPQLEEVVLTSSLRYFTMSCFYTNHLYVEDLRLDCVKALCRGAAKRKAGSKSLRSLAFNDFTFNGGFFDGDNTNLFDSIGVAASQLPDLESLKIINCQGCRRADLLDLFAQLAQVPTLKHLEVVGWERLRWERLARPQEAVSHLELFVDCLRLFWESRPALESFEFGGLEFNWEVLPLIQRSCPNLRVLKVGQVDLQTQPARDALLNFLNNGVLRELEFCPSVTGQDQEGKRLREFLAVALPEALRNNKHLKACRIRLTDMAIIDSCARIPLDLQVAWLVLVRDHNHVLQDLCLKSGTRGDGSFLYEDHRMHAALQHYLMLNKLGKGCLLKSRYQENGSKEDWLLALERCNMMSSPVYGNADVSCLYGLLRLNPEVLGP